MKSTGRTIRTHEGGRGYLRDARSELFLLSVANFVYKKHDRVLIVTDEQAAYHHHGDPTEQVPAAVPVHTWNRAGHGASDEGNRHVFGGLSDAAFRTVRLLEAGENADWPWTVG